MPGVSGGVWRIRRAYSLASSRAWPFGGCFGPHVGDRLLGIGQRERPAVVVANLDPVDELDLAVLAISTSVRITIPFCSHGVTTVSWARWTLGQLVDHLGEASPGAGQQLEHLHEVAAASNAGRKPGRM